MLHMPWCIIEHKQALSKAICVGLEDTDGMLNFFHELLPAEEAIMILARLEYDAGLPAVQ
jgi:hypothetical protein